MLVVLIYVFDKIYNKLIDGLFFEMLLDYRRFGGKYLIVPDTRGVYFERPKFWSPGYKEIVYFPDFWTTASAGNVTRVSGFCFFLFFSSIQYFICPVR